MNFLRFGRQPTESVQTHIASSTLLETILDGMEHLDSFMLFHKDELVRRHGEDEVAVDVTDLDEKMEKVVVFVMGNGGLRGSGRGVVDFCTIGWVQFVNHLSGLPQIRTWISSVGQIQWCPG